MLADDGLEKSPSQTKSKFPKYKIKNIQGDELPFEEKMNTSGLKGKKRNPMQVTSKTITDKNSKLKMLNYSNVLNKDSGNFQGINNDQDFNKSRHQP